jgi:hypothetical protein
MLTMRLDGKAETNHVHSGLRLDAMWKDGVLLVQDAALSTGYCLPQPSPSLVGLLTVASSCAQTACNLHSYLWTGPAAFSNGREHFRIRQMGRRPNCYTSLFPEVISLILCFTARMLDTLFSDTRKLTLVPFELLNRHWALILPSQVFHRNV